MATAAGVGTWDMFPSLSRSSAETPALVIAEESTAWPSIRCEAQPELSRQCQLQAGCTWRASRLRPAAPARYHHQLTPNACSTAKSIPGEGSIL